MKCRILLVILACLLFLQGCSSNEPLFEYNIKRYPSNDAVKNMFFENKSDFITVVKLLQEKNEFFYQNDYSLFPRKRYNYSEFFTEGEWQDIGDFLTLSGLLCISYDNIWVGKGYSKRYGKRIALYFSMSEPGVHCAIVYLSSSDDEEIKNEMKKQWLRVHGMYNTVEMEELGDGWFLFTHYELPDD